MRHDDHCCFFVGRRERMPTPEEVKNATSRLLVPVNSTWKNLKSGKVVTVIEVRACRTGHLVYYRDERGYSRKADLDDFYKKWQEQ